MGWASWLRTRFSSLPSHHVLRLFHGTTTDLWNERNIIIADVSDNYCWFFSQSDSITCKQREPCVRIFPGKLNFQGRNAAHVMGVFWVQKCSKFSSNILNKVFPEKKVVQGKLDFQDFFKTCSSYVFWICFLFTLNSEMITVFLYFIRIFWKFNCWERGFSRQTSLFFTGKLIV